MKSKMNSLLVFTIALLMIGNSEALAAKRNGLNSFNFGNNQAGAKGSYSIVTENGANFSSIQLTATGNVMFLKKTIKGVEFSATTQNSSGKKTAIYSLSVAGYTVDTGTKSVSYTWNKPINRTLVQASATITVGPVPVTVSGSVGGGANVGYTFELSSTGVGLSGNASAWANGSASAGVGVSLLNLSLKSDLELAKNSFVPSIKVSPASFSGKADLVYEPVNIAFSVVLQSMGHAWYQYDLAKFSQPSKTTTLIQL